MNPILTTILIYARDMQRTADFYTRYFGFKVSEDFVEGLITLEAPDGGAHIVVHQAARGVKLGQVGVKMVFAVRDVEAFKTQSAKLGLKFGATHKGPTYSFANAKDPDKNSVCISSRPFSAKAS